jgi:hypothetical protein
VASHAPAELANKTDGRKKNPLIEISGFFSYN